MSDLSDFTSRLAAIPDADLIAEMQAALDNLTPADLLSLPTPGLTPFLGTPCGDDQPDPDGDRDYAGPQVCPQCDHDLELNADFRCVRCGAHA